MKALVIEGPRKASVQEVPYPKPGLGEVTIKVEIVGICGTDFHIFEGDFISPFPLIPGHEFSGVIYELGEGVTDFRVGDQSQCRSFSILRGMSILSDSSRKSL